MGNPALVEKFLFENLESLFNFDSYDSLNQDYVYVFQDGKNLLLKLKRKGYLTEWEVEHFICKIEVFTPEFEFFTSKFKKVFNDF
jgi:hypothetical protein